MCNGTTHQICILPKTLNAKKTSLQRCSEQSVLLPCSEQSVLLPCSVHTAVDQKVRLMLHKTLGVARVVKIVPKASSSFPLAAASLRNASPTLAHRHRGDFCDLRLRCPSRTPEIAGFPRQEKAMMHCDLRVRWKVASDSRFRAAISEPQSPFFLRDFWRFGSVNAEIASDCDCAILVRNASPTQGCFFPSPTPKSVDFPSEIGSE